MIDLKQGDCLEIMKDIPDKSINLVLIDPPYNIKKAKWDKWKTVNDYVEFMGKVFLEIQRILKDNGSFYFFHNDMIQIAQLMEWIRLNSKFIFNSFVIWDKGDFRSLSWKKPSEKNNLRSWFNTCEYCLYYTFQDETGLSGIYANGELFKPIKKYLEQQKGNLTNKEINELLEYPSTGGGYASHYFTKNGKQWGFITKEHYEKLKQKTGRFTKEYEELRQEYEELRQEYEELRYIHNLDENHNNIWKSKERNNGKLHPTQKPNDILERIIKTSSNENDVVLDCFMGSGSTGVACINTNRKFIGIELDEKYFNIAKERIESTLNKECVF